MQCLRCHVQGKAASTPVRPSPVLSHRVALGRLTCSSAAAESQQAPEALAPSAVKKATDFLGNIIPLAVPAPLAPKGTAEEVATFVAARLTPTPLMLHTWQTADAVCFDVDCTITVNDSLDLLAEFLGVKEQVEELTNLAMEGTMSLDASLEERLRIINCTPDDLKLFIRSHPPSSRLAPGIEGLIKALQARGKAIYLISGGFRELILPIAAHLGIPKENVYANRMQWHWDDETGAPTSLAGFDPNQPTSRNKGKVEAIAEIRAANPYNTIVMVGDGITDLEAVQSSKGADMFIGYGGVIERPAVVAEAEWYVRDYDVLVKSLKRSKVAIVGSGAWACAVARMIAQNTLVDDPAQEFVDEVAMWVHEEEHEGRKLSELINKTHENPKYFPGCNMGHNVVACPDLAKAVDGADMIVLCVPHQFMGRVLKQLAGKVKPGAIAISLTKGMDVRPEGPRLLSQMVRKALGIDCCVLMGANIAEDIAREEFSEGVVGYNNIENGEMFKKLIQRPYFKVTLLPDSVGAEMCGTLKSVVALGAGMVDGLGMGANAKAIVIKQGLNEMRALSKALFPQVREETFYESCGVGDLLATCYGGRHRLVAEEWTRKTVAGEPVSFSELEAALLRGHRLQGLPTLASLMVVLKARGWEAQYPLFTTIHRIIMGELAPALIIKGAEGVVPPPEASTVTVSAYSALPAAALTSGSGALPRLAASSNGNGKAH